MRAAARDDGQVRAYQAPPTAGSLIGHVQMAHSKLSTLGTSGGSGAGAAWVGCARASGTSADVLLGAVVGSAFDWTFRRFGLSDPPSQL